jgi:hypothetical protein
MPRKAPSGATYSDDAAPTELEIFWRCVATKIPSQQPLVNAGEKV